MGRSLSSRGGRPPRIRASAGGIFGLFQRRSRGRRGKGVRYFHERLYVTGGDESAGGRRRPARDFGDRRRRPADPSRSRRSKRAPRSHRVGVSAVGRDGEGSTATLCARTAGAPRGLGAVPSGPVFTFLGFKARLSFGVIAILAASAAGCAAFGPWVRQYTYPPDFRYITPEQLHSTMWQLAYRSRELHRLMSLTGDPGTHRSEIIEHLRAMEAAADQLNR